MSISRPASEAGYVSLWLLGLCVCLFFIGGLALDLWRVFSERRALAGMVDAASIAGASGVDEVYYRQTGELKLSPTDAETLALTHLESQRERDAIDDAEVVATDASITVTAGGSVDVTLLRVLLPGLEPLKIEVTATAVPQEGVVE
jgi:hypothetical protein